MVPYRKPSICGNENIVSSTLAGVAVAMPIIILTWHILFVYMVDALTYSTRFNGEWLCLCLCDIDFSDGRLIEW